MVVTISTQVLPHGFFGKGALLTPTHGVGEKREGAPPRALILLSGAPNRGWGREYFGRFGLGIFSLTPILAKYSFLRFYILV